MPNFQGLSYWLAFAHRAYGSWPMLLEAQWLDAWVKHCKATGRYRLINWAYGQCPTLWPKVWTI